MPYTKRIPVHAGERGTGLYNCLEYVRNGVKIMWTLFNVYSLTKNIWKKD